VTDHSDRETPFTDAEFDALPRYANGRVIDLPMAYAWITAEQRERLHEDDWSYMDELDEEMAYLRAEFEVELIGRQIDDAYLGSEAE
jgi:hypothetical protein